MRQEHYFRLSLTENEHYFVEDILRQECQKSGLEVKYYRKIKTGHIPLIREVKVIGNFGELQKILKNNRIDKCLVEN